MHNKIYRTLRSLFRLFILNKNKSPEILIELEASFLKDILLNLSPKEIKLIAEGWPKFLKEESKRQLSFDKESEKEIIEYINVLN